MTVNRNFLEEESNKGSRIGIYNGILQTKVEKDFNFSNILISSDNFKNNQLIKMISKIASSLFRTQAKTFSKQLPRALFRTAF